MNFKRLAAGITAVACCAGLFTMVPEIADVTYASEAVKNDFETDYEGWYANDDLAALTAIEGEGFGNSRGMKITGRTSADVGAASSKGFYLWGGKEYDYSIQVKADTAETFHLSLLYKDEETDEASTVELVSKNAKAGKWTELSASFEAPENTYEYLLTITTDSTSDFTFDDVVITTEETGVSAAPAGKGLKDEFANYGFLVGNILNGGTVKNSAITAIILKDHNAIECENETKPDATINANGSTNTDVKVHLNGAAAILDFAVKNNLAFRGHTLVWHSQTPEWFFKEGFNNNGAYVTPAVMDQRMESYIKNMFALYKAQYPTLNLYAYDVCNEVIFDGTANNGGARPTQGDGRSAWVQVYGNNSFVEKAFSYARKYAPPTCKLFYNDYNEFANDKQNCIINTILKPLQAKSLIDGMGMQSHVSCAANNAWGDTVSYLAAMDKYLDLGLEVHVSELDLSTEGGKFSQQQQADKYKAIFQHAMDVNKSGKYKGGVTLVQVWGPNDANTWIKTENAPLLYDTNNQPKPAYTAVTSLVPDSEWGDGSNVGTTIEPPKPNDFGWWFQHGFENELCGWEKRGGTTIESSNREHYTEYGSNSLYISGREDSWNAAQYTLSPRIFEAGETYSFSAHAKYTSGNDTEIFKFTMEYTGSDGETHWDEIATSAAVPDKWVQLANTEYTIPEGASNMKIYVETIDSTTSFYIDEVIGAVGGTGIPGEGPMNAPSQPGERGDLDGNGIINVFDLCLAKRALKSGSVSSAVKKAADIDQNNVFEADDIKFLQQFIVRKITEFPVNEPVIPPVDTEALAAKFAGVTAAGSWKKDGENNVLWTQRFGADPGFMVYKDRLYVYTTNDAVEYRSDGSIQPNSYNSGTINCYSSADLVNWTDHGAIPAAGRNGRTTNGAAKWASFAWAPDACWKTINGKDKFFLYFADSAGGIGVLTADSPEGPYTDPIGKALVNHQSPNCSDVCWMFDPGVFVDDDGTGYLYFGGGVDNRDKEHPKTGRCVKLGDDMISLGGTPVTMDTPYLFEDSSIIKIGKTYYYSYCTNWNVPGGNNYGFNSGEIAYMTSDNPLGPFTYRGVALKNPAAYQLDGGGNNHHSIVEFKGKHYILYHSRHLSREMGIQAKDNNGNIDLGGNYRSTHIDQATVGADGKISCTGSMKGVSQLETLNPYTTVQAETMSNQSKGIVVNGLYNTTVAGKKGEWIKTSGVNFSKGAKSATLRASSKSGAVIRITTGSASGTVVGYAEVPAGGSMSDITVPVENVSGTKDLYFTFSGDLEFDSWSFAG